MALRDGLWDVARTRALRVNDNTAKLIVLETYAREGNWRGLLAAYDAMGYPAGDGFAYYRAVALFKEGSVAAASNLLAGVTFANADFARPAARLRAELLLAGGNPNGALAVLKKDGGNDIETKMMTASVNAEVGKADAAKFIWREVAADTNVPERIRATAAAGLPDRALLTQFATNAAAASVRRFATLKLGVLLLRDDATFAEGEKMIRDAVRDNPDADGAREAFTALVLALLRRQEFPKAAKDISDALEMWPAAAKDAALHECRGWVLNALGNLDGAIDEYRTAEELAPNAERKAVAAVGQADVLAKAGRVEESTAAYQRVRDAYPGTKAAADVGRAIRLGETEAKGRELYKASQFDEARKVFAELAKEDRPNRERLAYYGVLCAYGSGDDAAAEKSARALSAGAREATVRADATQWLAKFAFNRHRWDEAEKLFSRYADMVPLAADAPQALAWSARAALAENDFTSVISNAAKLVARYPKSPACAAGMLAQGEALIELARFDEAVLVLDRAALVPGASDADRLGARIMRADALFAMGADNPARYKAALDAYNAIRTGETLSPSAEISLSFKVAKTLEKLKRADEATDMYYTQVVLAYRTGRLAGTQYDEAARAAFARAAFQLADEFESRGKVRQAVRILELVRTSDVQAAGEAANRIDKMTKKGMFQ